jgi:hypothetical protein
MRQAAQKKCVSVTFFLERLRRSSERQGAEQKQDQEGDQKKMTTMNVQPRQSAKIYQFPVGGRASVGPRRMDSKPQHRSDLRTVNVAPTEAGSGWYHDAAIQDAKRTYEH